MSILKRNKVLIGRNGKILKSDIGTPAGGYGLLYNWYVTQDARQITSSDDWIVPTKTHWSDMAAYLGGSDPLGYWEVIGGYLKESGFAHWDSPNEGAVNSVAFNGIGGGKRENASGTFYNLKKETFWWNTEEYPYSSIYALNSSVNNLTDRLITTLSFFSIGYKVEGASIRLCNPTTELLEGATGTYTQNDGIIIPTIVINGVEWTMNLKEKKYRDGSWIHGFDGGTYTPIADATWAALTTPALCVYNNNLSNI